MIKQTRMSGVLAVLISIAILAVGFPAVENTFVTFPATPPANSPIVTVNQAPVSSPVTVTQAFSSCSSGQDTSQPRLDYILNTDCNQIVIRILPSWPRLTVINPQTTNRLFVQKLSAPPQVRWVNALQTPQVFEITAASNPINRLGILRVRYFVQTILTSNSLLLQPKTLAELQVQRC